VLTRQVRGTDPGPCHFGATGEDVVIKSGARRGRTWGSCGAREGREP
ncbi:hypothetical protein Gotur_012959, partial [Gossypium turneri]